MTGPNIVFDSNNQKTFDLESLKSFANEAKENAKVLVTNDKVSIKGAITSRLAGTKGARLETAHIFLATLKKEYGETIANELVKDPEVSSLLNGKPLSARRIKNVLTRAENRLAQLEGRLQDLKAVLKDCPTAQITTISQTGVKTAFNLATHPEIENSVKMLKEIDAVLKRRDDNARISGKEFLSKSHDGTLPKALMDAAEKTIRPMLQAFGFENLPTEDFHRIVQEMLCDLPVTGDDGVTVSPSDLKQLLAENKTGLLWILAKDTLKAGCPDFEEKALLTLGAGVRQLLKGNEKLRDTLNACSCREDFDAFVQTVQMKLNMVADKVATLEPTYEKALSDLVSKLQKDCAVAPHEMKSLLVHNRKLQRSALYGNFIEKVFAGKSSLENASQDIEQQFGKFYNRSKPIIDGIKTLNISDAIKARQISNHLFAANELTLEIVDVMRQVDNKTAELIREGNWAERLLHFESKDQLKATLQECFKALQPAIHQSLKDFAEKYPGQVDALFLQLCGNVINAHLSSILPKTQPSPALLWVMSNIALEFLQQDFELTSQCFYKAMAGFFLDPTQTNANLYTKENLTEDLEVQISYESKVPVELLKDYDFSALRQGAEQIIDNPTMNSEEKTGQLHNFLVDYIRNQKELLQVDVSNPEVAKALQKTIAQHAGTTNSGDFQEAMDTFIKPFAEGYQLVSKGKIDNKAFQNLSNAMQSAYDEYAANLDPKPTETEKAFYLRAALCMLFEQPEVRDFFKPMSLDQIAAMKTDGLDALQRELLDIAQNFSAG